MYTPARPGNEIPDPQRPEKRFFYLDYSLRTCDFCRVRCLLPIAPAIRTYHAEFLALCDKYHPSRFLCAGNTHDFDRDETSPDTAKLLDETGLSQKNSQLVIKIYKTQPFNHLQSVNS